MLSVTIDTAVFGPPPADAPAEAVHGFVTTLLEWRDAMNDGRVDVYTSKFAASVLMECHLYPMRPQLRELLRHAAVFEYDANTIAVLAETILGRSQKIEDLVGISDVLVDELSIDPDVFAAHTPPALRNDAQRCAVVVSLVSRYLDEPLLRGHAIAIRARDFGTAIQVRGLLQDVEHDRDDLAGLPMAPAYFEGSAVVCSSLHRLLMGLDEVEILRGATAENHVRAAINIGVYKHYAAGGGQPDWRELPPFVVGRQFFASLESHHVMSGSGLAERVIRAAIEAVCHENLGATHGLRTGSGGGDPQRMRGRDAAWRRDVDYEYHLHYWECQTGAVELAGLVVHNDFSIPE